MLTKGQMTWRRLLHIYRPLAGVEKSPLAKLRRKTGFSISNCKKALELHNNDIEKAESWLQAEAQAQGWAKAAKLSGRNTSQGLIGLHIKDNIAAMVEVNCETDFVAKNEKFKKLVAEITRNCLATNARFAEDRIIKEFLSQEQLKDLPTSSGKTMGDIVALAIGSIGENMNLQRAVRMISSPGTHLVGYCHPSSADDNSVLTGKLGAVVALKTPESLTDTARQLCIHVVGMNPKAVGNLSDTKAENSDDESLLVHQEFLSDNSMTVGEVLQEENIEVVDFVRFECGETQLSE